MKHTHLAALLSAILAVKSYACGPDFPPELLTNRQQSLQSLPEGNFYFEAMRLLPAPAKLLKADFGVMGNAGDADTNVPALSEARIKLETKGYSDAEKAAWQQARAATTAADAFAAAASLPPAHRQYVAGAVAYQLGDMAAAEQYFRAVIALKSGAEDRLLWAHYMLGQTLFRGGELSDAAMNEFQAVRDLVSAGAEDPMSLGMSSLGEQARWHLQSADSDQLPMGLRFASAVKLYAEQAAQELALSAKVTAQSQEPENFAGTNSGTVSLLLLARKISKDPALMNAAMQDALSRKLLIAYAFSRAGEIESFALQEAGKLEPNELNYESFERSKIAGSDGVVAVPDFVQRLADAMDGKQAEGADRMAAILYRAGKFALAQKYAKLSEAPLAHWVRAKLALRAGDAKTATNAFATAAKAFPQDADWVEGGEYTRVNASCRVAGESGTLALSRGEFAQALELFYAAGENFDTDFIYIAERVVTIAELKSFVDKNTKAAPVQATAENQGASARVRKILAKRLMRLHKYDEALPYFANAPDKKAAQAYVAALHKAEQLKGIARAEALFGAAKIARTDGISILAMELDPDFAIYDGSYANFQYDEEGNQIGGVSDRAPPKDLYTSAERQRFTESAVKPLRRFSYRYQGVQLAEQAAALVPARSQAYAAMLCEATRWIIYRDTPEAQRLYAKYLANGAYVPWGEQFGSDCPAPEFARAQKMLDVATWRQRKRVLKRALPYAAAGVVALMLAGIVLMLRARKAKA
jgi:cellulose synthase operon protein C